MINRATPSAELPSLVILGGIALSIGVGLVVPYATSWDPVVAWSLAILVLVLTPILLQYVNGSFDALAPLLTFSVTWVMMFVLRPMENLANNDTSLRGTYEVGDYYVSALIVAFIGACAFLVGYHLPYWTRVRRSQRPMPDLPVSKSIYKLVAVACFAPALIVLIRQFGVGLGGVTAYIYYLPLMLVGSSLILLAMGEGKINRWSLLGMVAICLFSLNYLIVGQRFFLLLGITAVAVFLWTVKGRRISFPKLILYSLILIYGILGPLVTWRSDDAKALPLKDRTTYTLSSSATAWEDFVSGPSNEMLPALALQISTEGTVWEHDPGYLPKQILGHWVPRSLWPEKNISVPELLYRGYFPDHYEISRANVQFSILGEFYYDSGVIGVVIGMFAYGSVSRLVWQSFIRNQHSIVAHLFYAPFLPLLLIVLRGDTALILSQAMFIYLPLLLAKVWQLVNQSSEGTDYRTQQADVLAS